MKKADLNLCLNLNSSRGGIKEVNTENTKLSHAGCDVEKNEAMKEDGGNFK